LDAPLGALAVLESSVAALPDSFVAPPQTLKTLASWLYMAAGVLSTPESFQELRSFASEDDLYPLEIYVASFALLDLDPGLYHFDPRAFCLRKLRDGPETLAQLKRGRPDLEFLKRAPGALLVTSNYSRAAAAHGRRGYRSVLVDCGKAVQNLVTVASGLGIQTITRLRMTESTTRELIGVPVDGDFSQEESVQSMVVWADRSQREAIETHVPAVAARQPATRTMFRSEAHKPVAINEGGVAVASLDVTDLMLPSMKRATMPAIVRNISASPSPYAAAILGAQDDCVAPGMAVREIRPPLTELTPMPADFRAAHLGPPGHHGTGLPLRELLLATKPVKDFGHDAIPRDTLRTLSRTAFAGGTYFPLFPDGVHSALVRPFWVVHHVAGMEEGIWFHRADVDEWCLLRSESLRFETKYLALEEESFGNAAAVCFMVANLHVLLLQGGPETYRLAHVEAGTIAQRLSLAAGGFELGVKSTSLFFDDEVRKFLGLGMTGWEPIMINAVGRAER
jgi:SagB-type dehydrogenase family enzyme